MDFNFKFGKLPTTGGIEYAPTFFQNADGSTTFAPDEGTYNANGYYRIVHNPQPTHGEDEIVVGGHYVYADEDGKHVIKTDWHIVAKPVDRADYDAAMEAHLRAERDARGYTDREPTDYALSSVPRFAQDARDWAAHRDAVMLYGLDIINRFIETGTAPTLSEFKDGLPKITWTEA